MARLDKYLEKLNGGQGDIPAPQSSLDKQMATLAESGGGGDEVVFVVFSMDETTETITASKTHAEVAAAIAENKLVVGTSGGAPLNCSGTVGSAFEFVAAFWDLGTNKVRAFTLLLKADNSCEFKYQKEYTLTPAT